MDGQGASGSGDQLQRGTAVHPGGGGAGHHGRFRPDLAAGAQENLKRVGRAPTDGGRAPPTTSSWPRSPSTTSRPNGCPGSGQEAATSRPSGRRPWCSYGTLENGPRHQYSSRGPPHPCRQKGQRRSARTAVADRRREVYRMRHPGASDRLPHDSSRTITTSPPPATTPCPGLLVLLRGGQVVAAGEGVGVVGAEHTFAGGERGGVEVRRFLVSPEGVQGVGEVAAAGGPRPDPQADQEGRRPAQGPQGPGLASGVPEGVSVSAVTETPSRASAQPMPLADGVPAREQCRAVGRGLGGGNLGRDVILGKLVHP